LRLGIQFQIDVDRARPPAFEQSGSPSDEIDAAGASRPTTELLEKAANLGGIGGPPHAVSLAVELPALRVEIQVAGSAKC